MKEELKTVLRGIAKKWENHDFTGEIVDDRLWDAVVPETLHYLQEDVEALEATATAEDDRCQAIGSGQRMVLLMYLRLVVKDLEKDFDQVLS